MASITPIHNGLGVMLVRDMAEYVKTGVAGPGLKRCEEVVGASPMRLVCIALLSWLKSRARFTRLSAMKLREAGSAAAALAVLVESHAPFSTVFDLTDDAVRLSDDVERLEGACIVVEAAKLYEPPRFITRRG